jgi:hypothetical protein
MALFDAVTSLFKKKKTLDQIDPVELRRERIKLEQIETRITREIEQIEKQKEELFRRGVEGGSQRQRVQMARKIQELDAQVKAKDKQLALISKNLRVLSGVAQLRENQQMLQQMGLGSIVSKMDMDELQAYVERATIEGQFQMEKFTELLSVMEAGDTLDVGSEDAETRAILEAMEAAAHGGEGSLDEGYKKMEQALKRRDEEDPLT